MENETVLVINNKIEISLPTEVFSNLSLLETWSKDLLPALLRMEAAIENNKKSDQNDH